jgi:hypothetical protein
LFPQGFRFARKVRATPGLTDVDANVHHAADPSPGLGANRIGGEARLDGCVGHAHLKGGLIPQQDTRAEMTGAPTTPPPDTQAESRRAVDTRRREIAGKSSNGAAVVALYATLAWHLRPSFAAALCAAVPPGAAPPHQPPRAAPPSSVVKPLTG